MRPRPPPPPRPDCMRWMRCSATLTRWRPRCRAGGRARRRPALSGRRQRPAALGGKGAGAGLDMTANMSAPPISTATAFSICLVAEDGVHHRFFLGAGRVARPEDVSDRLPARSEGNALAVGDVNGDKLPTSLSAIRPRRAAWRATSCGSMTRAIAATSSMPARTCRPQPATKRKALCWSISTRMAISTLVIANQSPTNRLLLNDGKGRFTDASDRLGKSVPTQTARGPYAGCEPGRPARYPVLQHHQQCRDVRAGSASPSSHPASRWALQRRDERRGMPANTFSAWGAMDHRFRP